MICHFTGYVLNCALLSIKKYFLQLFNKLSVSYRLKELRFQFSGRNLHNFARWLSSYNQGNCMSFYYWNINLSDWLFFLRLEETSNFPAFDFVLWFSLNLRFWERHHFNLSFLNRFIFIFSSYLWCEWLLWGDLFVIPLNFKYLLIIWFALTLHLNHVIHEPRFIEVFRFFLIRDYIWRRDTFCLRACSTHYLYYY